MTAAMSTALTTAGRAGRQAAGWVKEQAAYLCGAYASSMAVSLRKVSGNSTPGSYLPPRLPRPPSHLVAARVPSP